jgi:hypothetical protein
MNRNRSLLLLEVGLLAGAAVAVAILKFGPGLGNEVRTGISDEVMVMRTRGGLLEVSRIHATESFDTRFVHTLLGIPFGETVPRIRVPVVYRYHIELAPEWQVRREGAVFTVVAPPVQPSLPVAVDFGRLEKHVSGTWVLLPFTGDDALDDLERTLTRALAKRAVMPAYLQLQREAARKTVTEFVEKWLVTQAQWQTASQPQIRVLFADEPRGAGSGG